MRYSSGLLLLRRRLVGVCGRGCLSFPRITGSRSDGRGVVPEPHCLNGRSNRLLLLLMLEHIVRILVLVVDVDVVLLLGIDLSNITGLLRLI
jgi:hypothetical protein